MGEQVPEDRIRGRIVGKFGSKSRKSCWMNPSRSWEGEEIDLTGSLSRLAVSWDPLEERRTMTKIKGRGSRSNACEALHIVISVVEIAQNEIHGAARSAVVDVPNCEKARSRSAADVQPSRTLGDRDKEVR